MSKVINFPDYDDLAIEIIHTEEFYKAAQILSDFIKGLPLNNADNDKLIELIEAQIKPAEQGAFSQGLKLGRDITIIDQKGNK